MDDVTIYYNPNHGPEKRWLLGHASHDFMEFYKIRPVPRSGKEKSTEELLPWAESVAKVGLEEFTQQFLKGIQCPH